MKVLLESAGWRRATSQWARIARVTHFESRNALLLKIEAAMHGLHKRTFQALMGALVLGSKQRLHSVVLRQPERRGSRVRRSKSSQFEGQAHSTAQ